MKHRKISFNRKNLFKKGWLVSLADYTYLIILAVIAAFPLIWIILSSLKSKGELIDNPRHSGRSSLHWIITAQSLGS